LTNGTAHGNNVIVWFFVCGWIIMMNTWLCVCRSFISCTVSKPEVKLNLRCTT
jgi:hypothetical protein